ncbi:MAG: hypothetical protein RLZZ427_1920 [Pseudomonadota bacterium]|jgi:PAS domain S-box-containing protein
MIKIRYYTPLVSALIFIGTMGIESYVLFTSLVANEWEASERALRSATSKSQGFLDGLFERQDAVGIRKVLSELYFDDANSQAALIDAQGRVLYSNHLGFENRPASTLAFPVDRAAVAQALGNRHANVLRSDQREALTAYYPVSLTRAGEEPFTRTGVLVVDYEMAERLADIRGHILRATMKVAPAILLVLGLTMTILHFALTRRMGMFRGTIRQYLQGNTAVRVPIGWRDEISEIGSAFNRLADAFDRKREQLTQANAELAGLAESLEQRVAERTQTLQHEIAQRRQAEASLEASQTELSSILKLAPDGIILIAADGAILRFNQSAETMFGWSERDVSGQNINLLIPPGDRAAHDRHLRDYQRNGTTRILGSDRELLAQRRDGTLFPIELSINAVSINGTAAFIGIARDVTVRREADKTLEQARASLVEAERMAALGNLVAGVAHEINTPVGIGVTAASHLREEFEAFDALYRENRMTRSSLETLLETSRSSTAIIESNLQRASDLIRSFKEVSVDQTGDEERTIGLAHYVGQVLHTLQPKYKNRPIAIAVEIDETIMVCLRPGAISQILTNCVINSLVHAFAPDQAGTIRIAARRKDDGIVLTYADDGVGMDAQTAARIFEPFYTTKRGQGGSGLGMHIVYNIVTAKFGGKIGCVSAPGEGMQLTLEIPHCLTLG